MAGRFEPGLAVGDAEVGAEVGAGNFGGGWLTFGRIATIALLGVVMAIPTKQQVINFEQLRFPTGVAAAETLRVLHGEGAQGTEKARRLGRGGTLGRWSC